MPVLAHPLADPEKGSGIAMICTFGDITDVTWWRELQLPTRTVVGWDGRLHGRPAGSRTGTTTAIAHWDELAGKTVKQAQQRDRRAAPGDGRPRRRAEADHPPGEVLREGRPPARDRHDAPVVHPQRRHDDPELRDALLARGRELDWHPAHMRARYERWVEGLNGDWLISRQRFFGVPFPVWYRARRRRRARLRTRRSLAPEDRLPVDPSSDVPDGFTEDQRGKPGGFVGDPDVMDTWATSSLTPQIASGWEDDPDLFARTFPMDLRPQAPEIIRTWLFSTRSCAAHFEHDALPWRDATITGWVLDPDRKKMSKSKGNVVTPMALLEQYGSDAVRYWAANGRPGIDTAFDEGQMKVGRRLAIKILNASKFALGVMGDEAPASRCDHRAARPLDARGAADRGRRRDARVRRLRLRPRARAHRAVLLGLLRRLPRAGEAAGVRPSGDDAARSARAALSLALSTLLRLFAPHLPFVTEEVWSWWQDGSVHRAVWPSADALGVPGVDTRVYDVAADVLGEVRKAKSSAQRSMRTEVTRAVVYLPPELSAPLAPRSTTCARRVGSRASSTSRPATSSASTSSSPIPTRRRDRGGAPRRSGPGSTPTSTSSAGRVSRPDPGGGCRRSRSPGWRR